MKRILLSWSSGKDSAWALHVLRRLGEYEVVGLLTTINAAADRVAMHGVRRELLEAQAEATGLPLWAVPLPWPCSNQDYERLMGEACRHAITDEIYGIAFGDLFLEEVRAYRERQLAGTGLQPLFPIWGIPTDQLACEMIGSGLRARLTCVDTQALPAEFAGREFDDRLLRDLEQLSAVGLRAATPASGAAPIGARGQSSSGLRKKDSCGECGEFHTFCYAGPMFSTRIPIVTGEIVLRDRFVFADFTLAGASQLGATD
jgi:diphthamide synthase (EF-2-diphthine--ammonia ligase)